MTADDTGEQDDADKDTASLPTWSPALALAPIIFLICGLAVSVYLFGADSSAGANQIVLVLSATLAGLVGLRVGVQWRDTQQGIVDGIALGMGPVLILLAVGMLIGTWILCGTVPAMIYYGVQLINPGIFYAASAGFCALVAISIGSSWTVAGTLGIGLMGIAGSFELSPAITAGAIVSGAYFGDKLSPMSDTTNLAAATVGVDLFEHIRHMLWTTVPGFLLALLIFALLGNTRAAAPEEITALQQSLLGEFNIGPALLLPLALMLILVYKRFPAYPAIIVSALTGALFALVFQQEAVIRLASMPGAADAVALTRGIWLSLFDGYHSHSGNSYLDTLLSKGGMSSMLNTVWLIICALGFGGALERTGILNYLLTWTLRRVRGSCSLVSTTVVTCIGTNALAADQFIAIALPGRMYADEYEQRGLSRLNLSRTLEDSGTLTSALIPWNTCGAYMSATLGVATLHYAPFAFFNLACPLLAIVYGCSGFAMKTSKSAEAQHA